MSIFSTCFVAISFALFLFFHGSVEALDKLRIGYSGATVSNAMLWVTDPGPDGDDRRRDRYVRLFRQLALFRPAAGR